MVRTQSTSHIDAGTSIAEMESETDSRPNNDKFQSQEMHELDSVDSF